MSSTKENSAAAKLTPEPHCNSEREACYAMILLRVRIKAMIIIIVWYATVGKGSSER